MKIRDEDLDFESSFSLTVGANVTSIDALCVSFDVSFGAKLAAKPVTMSTSRHCPQTHWKQTLLFLDERLELAAGEKLHGTLKARRPLSALRHYEIELLLNVRGHDLPLLVYALA